MPHNSTWPYNYASIWTQNNITSSISWLFTRLGYKCEKAFWLFPKIKPSLTGWGSATIVLIPNNVPLIWRKSSRSSQSLWDNGSSLDIIPDISGWLLRRVKILLCMAISHYLKVTLHDGNMILSLKIRLPFKNPLENPLHRTWEYSPLKFIP